MDKKKKCSKQVIRLIKVFSIANYTNQPQRENHLSNSVMLAADPLGPVDCGVRPLWIELVAVYVQPRCGEVCSQVIALGFMWGSWRYCLFIFCNV